MKTGYSSRVQWMLCGAHGVGFGLLWFTGAPLYLVVAFVVFMMVGVNGRSNSIQWKAFHITIPTLGVLLYSGEQLPPMARTAGSMLLLAYVSVLVLSVWISGVRLLWEVGSTLFGIRRYVREVTAPELLAGRMTILQQSEFPSRWEYLVYRFLIGKPAGHARSQGLDRSE